MPILRGVAITYGHSHLFLGITITTDKPDINENGSTTGFSGMSSKWTRNGSLK
ncbi:hypothetical protein NXW13_00835 [Bacteroides thetaiotaomicron]|nr:hypothetical protein [Bacteroides thetaiotaomicron]